MTGGSTSLHQAWPWTRRRLGCVALISLLVPTLAGAAPLAEPDARAVRRLVEAQLEAFAADDAPRAYSYASASIQAQFGDAITFMAMVRNSYPMVVRPAAVSFFRPHVEAGTPATVTQLVQLRDREGRLWRASYRLEQETGGAWRISGCVVTADSGKSST